MKTIKLFAMFCAALALCNSCLTGVGTDEDMNAPVKPQIPADGELVLTATPSTIVADGEDFAKLVLTKGGVEITEDFILYDGSNQEVNLPDMKFSTTKKGKYEFWAAYGTDYTETIEITAAEKRPDAPDAPEDNNPDKINFKRRVLLIQFTGTGCGYCPGMTATLRQIMSDTTSQKYNENTILVAAHRYNGEDPAYLEGASLDQAMGIASYPQVAVDMHTRTTNYYYGPVSSLLDNAIARVNARAGIAAVSEYDEATRTISVTATLKAGEKQCFRMGAWLIEDGVYGKQQNYGVAVGNFDIHDHCIRVADSKRTNIDFTGYTLKQGEVEVEDKNGNIKTETRELEFEVGETVSHSFSIKLKSNWVADNCRLVLFVTSPEKNSYGKSYFYVNNAVEMPIDGSIDYEYLDEE